MMSMGKKILVWVSFVPLALGVFFGLAWIFENWFGTRELDRALARMEKAGLPTKFADVIPGPARREGNFFAIPALDGIDWPTWDETTETFVDPGEEKRQRIATMMEPKKAFLAWKLSNRSRNTRFYQDFQVLREELGLPEVGTAESQVLAWFEREHGAILGELIEGSRLPVAELNPQSRPEMTVPESLKMDYPHYDTIQTIVRAAACRANAAIHEGEGQLALDHIRVCLRIRDAAIRDGSLLAVMLGITCDAIACRPIWEGLGHRVWSESQLQEIQELLTKADWFKAYETSLTFECLYFTQIVEYLANYGGSDVLEEYFDVDMPNFLPSGWWRHNAAVQINHLLDHHILPVANRDWRRLTEESASVPRFLILASTIVPIYRNVTKRLVYTRTHQQMASTAAELEKHYLATGSYPSTIDELPIEATDPMSGQPFKFTPTADGRYKLYSISLNQIDDGGKEVFKRPEKRSGQIHDEGDWVWEYPPPLKGNSPGESPPRGPATGSSL